MREIRTEIEIAVPPTKVWSILMDFDNWKEWSPIINQASGVAALGPGSVSRCVAMMAKTDRNICLL